MKLKFQLTFNPSDEENNLGGEFDARKDGVFVCGSLDLLGSWHLTRALEMKTTAINTTELHSTPDSYSSYSSLSSVSSLDLNSESSFPGGISNGSTTISTKSQSNCFEFETTIDLDESAMKFINEHNGIQYKYFVAQKSSSESRPIFLKQIEYNWRQVDAEKLASGNSVELSDKWPLVDVEQQRTRIDSGWLIDQAENELQFHFFNWPLELWSRPSNADLVVDIVPLKHASPSGAGGLTILKDYLHLSNDFDENNSMTNRRTRLNSLNEPGFYSSHRVRFRENPSDLLFQINLHVIDEEGRIDEKQPPIATGYYKVNKYILENSLVDVDISLMSANQMVGTLKTEVLIITGPKKLDNTMIKKNFNYHFNKSCIPIGHRGMGKTFDAGTLPGTNFVENTIESFREAYNRGAQMVEFDIVLTKDKIPIVYHDFVFCIDQLSSNADKKQQQQQQQQDENTNPTTNTNTKSQSNNNLLSLAVNMLTYDEVKQNRIYSQKILKKSPNLSDELKEFFTSKMMFPTLKEMCTQLDPKLGFNVEIKYPIDLEDGSHEVEDHLIKWLNRNEYVDCILNELYEWCKDDNRCVILSSFDPNLCSMLRMKQNKFPVLFLTNGVTNKWVPYKDARCKKTRISLNFAKTENLHGIVAHAEELTKNLHLINILFNHASKSANFLAYSWGDDLNELDKRRLLTESGINGIIYDRINESK